MENEQIKVKVNLELDNGTIVTMNEDYIPEIKKYKAVVSGWAPGKGIHLNIPLNVIYAIAEQLESDFVVGNYGETKIIDSKLLLSAILDTFIASKNLKVELLSKTALELSKHKQQLRDVLSSASPDILALLKEQGLI